MALALAAVVTPRPTLESRHLVAHLAAAEDAASRNYSFPEEPEHYSTNVRSDIVRLLYSVGQLRSSRGTPPSARARPQRRPQRQPLTSSSTR